MLAICAVTGFRPTMPPRAGGRGLEPGREASAREEDEEDSEKGEEEAPRGRRGGEGERFRSSSKPASLGLPHLVRPAHMQNRVTPSHTPWMSHQSSAGPHRETDNNSLSHLWAI